MATAGTVRSGSYVLETEKFFPGIHITQEACPEWVELVESGKHRSAEADIPVKTHINNLLKNDPAIDTILLACTHYPLLTEKITAFAPAGIAIIQQGRIIAESLVKYLENHREIDEKCSKSGGLFFYTTGDETDFNSHASVFFGSPVSAAPFRQRR